MILNAQESLVANREMISGSQVALHFSTISSSLNSGTRAEQDIQICSLFSSQKESQKNALSLHIVHGTGKHFPLRKLEDGLLLLTHLFFSSKVSL